MNMKDVRQALAHPAMAHVFYDRFIELRKYRLRHALYTDEQMSSGSVLSMFENLQVEAMKCFRFQDKVSDLKLHRARESRKVRAMEWVIARLQWRARARKRLRYLFRKWSIAHRRFYLSAALRIFLHHATEWNAAICIQCAVRIWIAISVRALFIPHAIGLCSLWCGFANDAIAWLFHDCMHRLILLVAYSSPLAASLRCNINVAVNYAAAVCRFGKGLASVGLLQRSGTRAGSPAEPLVCGML